MARVGLMEKSHSLSHYLGPLENRLHKAGIRTLAFLKGDLVFSRLERKSRMVMRLMTWLMPQVCQGCFLDTEAISRWVLSEIHHRK